MDKQLSLDEIGLECGTDKASATHGYLRQYERFFERFRHERITLLEIGVLGGASLKMWETYFPNATIIGADIHHATRRFAGGRVKIELLDQSNVQELADLALRYAPFDIIIEDGSHFWEHQIISLKTLFPFLKNGGLYVVEDLQTNFGTLAANYRGVSSMRCMDYLKRLVEYQVGDEQAAVDAEEDAFLRTFGRSIGVTAFIRHACILEKQHTARVYGYENAPLAPQEADEWAGKLTLTAHVGHFGDVVSGARPFVHSATNGGAYIQGFRLEGDGLTAPDVQYRARLAGGGWTDWAGLGDFVGTRGTSLNLTGFAVRLGDRLRGGFEVEAHGAFGMTGGAVAARAGEDCVPAATRSLANADFSRASHPAFGTPAASWLSAVSV